MAYKYYVPEKSASNMIKKRCTLKGTPAHIITA